MLIKFNRLTGIILLIGMYSMSFSQDLLTNIQNMGEENAKGYFLPVVSSFGSALNSGTFHNAAAHKLLGFDITANLAYVPIPDKDKTFQFFIPLQFTIPFTYANQNLNLQLDGSQLYPDDRTVSTLFGPKGNKSFEPDENYVASALEDQFSVPPAEAQTLSTDIISEIPPLAMVGGLDFNVMGALIPQISVGLPLDIEVMARMLPEKNIDKIGKVSIVGFGGKIGLNQFIPLDIGILPRISAGYTRTNVTIGNIIDMTNTLTNLQISKRLLFLTLYGGYGVETSSVDVDYLWPSGDAYSDVPVKFSLDGKNKTRTTLGARIKLMFLSLQAEYNTGEYDSYNVGVSFSIR